MFKIDPTPRLNHAVIASPPLEELSVHYTVVGFNGPAAGRIEMLVEDEDLAEATALADELAACGYVDITVTTSAGKTYPPEELQQTKLA